jgi:hypothetical protein
LQLGKLGPQARVALPSLRAMSLDPDNSAVVPHVADEDWLDSLGPKRALSVREAAATAVRAIEAADGH